MGRHVELARSGRVIRTKPATGPASAMNRPPAAVVDEALQNKLGTAEQAVVRLDALVKQQQQKITELEAANAALEGALKKATAKPAQPKPAPAPAPKKAAAPKKATAPAKKPVPKKAAAPKKKAAPKKRSTKKKK